LEIFQDDGTGNVNYGYNLFYSTADSFVDATVTPSVTVNLRGGYYPAGALGVPQSTDIISTSVSTGNPMFVNFDGSFLNPNGAPNNNDFHLKAGSPAIGHGNPAYNNDMGAYTTDGQGNKH
jgi:hypothetical protein